MTLHDESGALPLKTLKSKTHYPWEAQDLMGQFIYDLIAALTRSEHAEMALKVCWAMRWTEPLQLHRRKELGGMRWALFDCGGVTYLLKTYSRARNTAPVERSLPALPGGYLLCQLDANCPR